MPFSAAWTDGGLCGLQGHPRGPFTIAEVNPLMAHASPLCLRHPFDTSKIEPFEQTWPVMSAAEIVNMLSRDAPRVLATRHATLNSPGAR